MSLPQCSLRLLFTPKLKVYQITILCNHKAITTNGKGDLNMNKEMLMNQNEINLASDFKVDEFEIDAASAVFIAFFFMN